MVEAVDVWCAVLSLVLTFVSARLLFVSQGLKGKPFALEMMIYCAVCGLAALTLFGVVLTRI